MNDSENAPATMAGAPGMRGPGRTVTAKEAKQRRVALADLLSNGLSWDEITNAMSDKFGMTEDQVERLASRVKSELQTEFESNAPFHKAMASRRLHRHIVSAQKARQWGAVANLESQLARIQGTESPEQAHITVDARLQQATLQVLGTLSPAQVQELVSEELRRLPSVGRESVIADGE